MFNLRPTKRKHETDETASVSSVSGGSLHYSCSTAPPLSGRPESDSDGSIYDSDQAVASRHRSGIIVGCGLSRKGTSTIRGVAACGRWKDDVDVHSCELCILPFSFTKLAKLSKNPSPAQRLKLRFGALVRRKHHCRQCGGIFCSKCCSEFIPIPAFNYTTEAEQRVCLPCFTFLCNQLVQGDSAHCCANPQQQLQQQQGKPNTKFGVGVVGVPRGGLVGVSRTSSAVSGVYPLTGRDSVSTSGWPQGETDVRFGHPHHMALGNSQHGSGCGGGGAISTANSSMVGGGHFQQVAVVQQNSCGNSSGSNASFASHTHPKDTNQHPPAIPVPPHFQPLVSPYHTIDTIPQLYQQRLLPGAERGAPLENSDDCDEEDEEFDYSSKHTTSTSQSRNSSLHAPPRPTFLAAPSANHQSFHHQHSNEEEVGDYSDIGAQAVTRSILQQAIISQSKRADDETNLVPFIQTQQQQRYGTSEETYYEEDDEEDWEEGDFYEEDEYEEGDEDEDYEEDEDDEDDEEYSTSDSSSDDLLAPPIPTHELLMALQPSSCNLDGSVASQNASFALTTRVAGDIDLDEIDVEDVNLPRYGQQHWKNQSSGNFYAQVSPASTGVAGYLNQHFSRTGSSRSPSKHARQPSGSASTFRLPGSSEPNFSPDKSGEHQRQPSPSLKSMVLSSDYVRVLQSYVIRPPSNNSSRRCNGTSPTRVGPQHRHGSRSPVVSSRPVDSSSGDDDDDSCGFSTPVMTMAPLTTTTSMPTNAPSFLCAPGQIDAHHAAVVAAPIVPTTTSSAVAAVTSNVITVLLYPSSGREQALVCTVSPTETLHDLANRVAENYYKLIFSPFRPRPSPQELQDTVRQHLRFLVSPALHSIAVDSKEAMGLSVFEVIALHDRVVLTTQDDVSTQFSASEVGSLRDFLDGAASRALVTSSGQVKSTPLNYTSTTSNSTMPSRFNNNPQQQQQPPIRSFEVTGAPGSPGGFYDGSSL